MLRYFLDLSEIEIAKALGVSQGTVKAACLPGRRLFRASGGMGMTEFELGLAGALKDEAKETAMSTDQQSAAQELGTRLTTSTGSAAAARPPWRQSWWSSSASSSPPSPSPP